MQIRFTTKEQSKAEQEAEFLALSGAERVMRFIALSNYILRNFPSQLPQEDKGNFVLELPKSKNDERKLG